MMKTSTPLAILLPLILLSTTAFSLGAQTPYMDAMYIDVVHKTMMHGPALRNLRSQQLLHRLPHPAQKLFAQDIRNFLI